ncbi:hypothetical protein EMCRGX_G015487 [Ephydatia muelleri]
MDDNCQLVDMTKRKGNQLTLLCFVLRVLGLSLNTTLSQQFKCFVPPSEAPSEAINSEALLLTPVTQKSLSSKLDDHLFKVLLDMSITPSEDLGLHLNPSQFQVAIKWWLGLDFSYGSCCPLCPEIVLDPLGHHAVTCKRGGDVVSRHNKLSDVLAESCSSGCPGGMGNNLTSHSAPVQLIFWFQTGSWASSSCHISA